MKHAKNNEHCHQIDKIIRFFLLKKYPMKDLGDYNNVLENEFNINTEDFTFAYIYNRQHNTYNVEKQDFYYTSIVTGTFSAHNVINHTK